MNWYQEIAKAAGVTEEELLAVVDGEAASVMALTRDLRMPIAEMHSRIQELADMRTEIERMFRGGDAPGGWIIIKDKISK